VNFRALPSRLFKTWRRRISLRVEYGAGERSEAAGGCGQRMHDHFTGVDHAVHSECEQFRVGLNDCGQARPGIGAVLKPPVHRVGEPDEWSGAAFENQCAEDFLRTGRSVQRVGDDGAFQRPSSRAMAERHSKSFEA
jgi:hypothetical protein